MAESDKQKCQRRMAELAADRSSWEGGWHDADDYMLPDRCQWTYTDSNRGDQRTSRIINSTAEDCFRTLGAGLFTGLCSPARPWFQYALKDRDLGEWGPVKQWLLQCADIDRRVMRGSNFYQEAPTTFENMGAFGQHCAIVERDQEQVFRIYSQPVGAYYLAASDRGIIDTIGRKVAMTARNIVRQFGLENVSATVKNLSEGNSNPQTPIEVVHIVMPNEEYTPNRIGWRGKRWVSIWYENGGDGDKLLRKSGFDEFPALCPRWAVRGTDSYGSANPGRMIRGDAKALQAYERNSITATDLSVNPPLQVPSELEQAGVAMIPGGLNYFDQLKGGIGIKPIFDANAFPIDKVELKIQQVERRIATACYKDLFLMLSSSDRRQVTAEEIRAKQEEKILALGPMWERANDEFLEPSVRWGFQYAQERGLHPPPPPELEGQEVTIDFVSPLAQVQKLLGLGGMDRLLGVVGNIAQAYPAVAAKINANAVVDEYASALDVPWRVVNSNDQANQIIAAAAQEKQAQAASEQALQAAEGAKLLSETDTSRQSLLTDIIANQTGTRI